MLQIRRRSEENRFEVVDGEEPIGVLTYDELGDEVVELESTVIDEEHRGQGVGTSLVRHALDEAEAAGLGVVPTCPFVEAVIDRNPEYAGLVVEAAGSGRAS